ncbi:hypothetical protein [Gloeocapsa sp. PCC 7428]|uniref:hypothetical protein n=1 Tax=Gloeocapsa sp. PCC 7428 TaxID=1173026 RepID=UPI0002EA07FA|nr:hypothetical protein [Gloeocapsa sp. PCC 7428]
MRLRSEQQDENYAGLVRDRVLRITRPTYALSAQLVELPFFKFPHNFLKFFVYIHKLEVYRTVIAILLSGKTCRKQVTTSNDA